MQCYFNGPACICGETDDIAYDSECGGAFGVWSAKEDTCNSSAGHWLSVAAGIAFKSLTLAYGTANESALTYLNAMTQLCLPSDEGLLSLSSHSSKRLQSRRFFCSWYLGGGMIYLVLSIPVTALVHFLSV